LIETVERLKDAAYATPDPERSFKNLSSFIEKNPLSIDELEDNLRNVSLLFSYSQFLANYCILNPEILFNALKGMDNPASREVLSSCLKECFEKEGSALTDSRSSAALVSLSPYMTAIRKFKTAEILKITLRDILKKVDLVETMIELSLLADVIIENSLSIVRRSLNEIYGSPANDAFSVIALGKLGGEELNFSSDVDLIFVYGTEIGETTGVTTSKGTTKNRITNHEYYCKLGEELTRFLTLSTGSGFVYRVDLRLRPEGQRGDIALALRGYEMYYESWGRAWERAMLLRARPIAGDRELAGSFMDMIKPFVYRKYLDFSAIDEIQRLKIRIDSTFKKNDIKRGYGGIREIEFFAQALQLIYGGREPLLREKSILKVLHRLLQKNLIGQEDYFTLQENYRFLRSLEHRLQQINDLQTHTIPTGEAEQDALAGKMGFEDRMSFNSDLEKRRAAVKSIYNSLFAEQKEDSLLSGTFFDEEFSDTELKEYLSATGLENVDKAVRNIRNIKDSILNFQTLRGRRLLSDILPVFVDYALKSNAPDMALNHLQSFASLLGARESYLEIFSNHRELIETLTDVFSQSEYLSKMLMVRPEFLEMIGWQRTGKKSLADLKDEIKAAMSEGRSVNDALRLIRQMEEIRLGFLFLRRKIDIVELVKGLSKTAEAILSLSLDQVSEKSLNLAVIGFGKLGAREISFGSDLDIIFASPEDVTHSDTKSAERFLRMLISYTKEGVAYRVDTRLRPEGSKGPLVSSIDSFREYYSKSAAFWEFQALLKARPIAGDIKTGRSFIGMAGNMIMSHGKSISAADIRQMRDKILRELARESEGYDIKLGLGGIEEIEFTVQYLQLVNCHKDSKLLVQGTIDAIKRLGTSGILDRRDSDLLNSIYCFYRTLEGFLRLKGGSILKREERILKSISVFMGYKSNDDFINDLEQKRKLIREISERYLSDR
jgi:[glutamine synthetase] adenylyltransferase / [glutamine synthetase]-adenylyl-L-tyrosine phosphorylase